MPSTRRECHGTRHFIFPRCVVCLIRCEGTPFFFSAPGGGVFCQVGAEKVGINMEMMIANHWQMKLKLIVAVGFVSTELWYLPLGVLGFSKAFIN